MDFSFIHAADLHIDSPLDALGQKDKSVAARFEGAGRRAVERLVAETISSGAAFLVIAGDIFDGDWRDAATGLFFVRQLGELNRAGIPVFIVKGNHDAESVVSRSLPLPGNVTVFDSAKADTFELADKRIALHGRSFPDRGVPAAFVQNYPARREGWLNIGILHTSLAGSSDHDEYAPCSAEDLRRFGYDYWALGHVHSHQIVARDPWIVYPGNIQGRSIRETGAKGAVRVVVRDGRIADAEHLPFDSARWEHETIDVSRCERIDDIYALAGDAIAAAHQRSGGLPLALRLTLAGASVLHGALSAGFCDIEDIRAIAFRHGADCWVEKIVVATKAQPRTAFIAKEDALDIQALITAAAADPAFETALHATIGEISGKLPKALQPELPQDENALQALAARVRDRLAGSLGAERDS